MPRLRDMLGNSGNTCSKYGTFYDFPVLLTLVRMTSATRQGAAESPSQLSVFGI
jgi:hypothetical protein